MNKIKGCMRWTDQHEMVEPGFLYRLDPDAPMLVEGSSQFRIFGAIKVDGVEITNEWVRIDADRFVLESSSPASGVLFTRCPIKVDRGEAMNLTPPQELEDPQLAQFKAWAIELGLLAPDPNMEFADDEDEDDFDDNDIPLDGDSLADLEPEPQDIPEDRKPAEIASQELSEPIEPSEESAEAD